jgi:hypothetical protein
VNWTPTKVIGTILGAVVVATVVVLSTSHHASAADSAGTVAAAPVDVSTLVVSTSLVTPDNAEAWGVDSSARFEQVVTVSGDAATETEAAWAANLIALSERLAASKSGAPAVVGVRILHQGADGSEIGDYEGLFDSQRPIDDAAGPTPMTSTQQQVAITQALAGLGLTPRSIAFLQVPGLQQAPVVVATASGDGGDFVRSHPFAVRELSTGSGPAFLEVDDSSGHPVEAIGAILAAGITNFWDDPAFGCFHTGCPPIANSAG